MCRYGCWYPYLQVRIQQGRLEEARHLAQEALVRSREQGERGLEARSLLQAAEACGRLYDLAVAQLHAREALALCRELGDRDGEARARWLLGSRLTQPDADLASNAKVRVYP